MTEEPVAVYDASTDTLRQAATNVYRVDGAVTAMTASIIGFTVGVDATDNYVIADGQASSQDWIINPAYVFNSNGTNGLYYLNDKTLAFNGIYNFLALVDDAETDSWNGNTLVSSLAAVKPSESAYDALNRVASTSLTDSMNVTYYYTTTENATFSVESHAAWTEMTTSSVV